MIDQLRAFTYERQRLGQAAPNAARALTDVIARLQLTSVRAALAARPREEDDRARSSASSTSCGCRPCACRSTCCPAKTAHLAFRATPAPPADRKKRMKHFKFTEKRYEELREQILKAATEPLTLPELREKVGAEPEEFKGISAQMTRDGELLRVGAKGLRSNELALRRQRARPSRRRRGARLARRRVPARLRADPRQGLHVVGRRDRDPRQAGARRARHRGARRRPADPRQGPQGVRQGQEAAGRRPAAQVGQLHDGLRARRARPLRPSRRGQAVLRLPRRRPPGDPRRRPGGGHVGEGRGRAVRQGRRRRRARRSTSASTPSGRSWTRSRPALDLHARPRPRVVRRDPARDRLAPARAAAPSARRTASRTPRGVQNRIGSRTPTPAQSARAAFSAMSPPAGETTTRQPHDRARISVPWPPCVTTRSQAGIVREYDSHGTTTAFAGAGSDGGSRPFQVAITRTGSSASPSSAARSSRCDGSWAVDGATSTTGPEPGGGATGDDGGSHSSGPTTRTHDGQSRGYSSCGSRRHQRQRPRDARCGRTAAARARAAPGTRCTPAARARARARRAGRTRATSGVRGSRAPIEYGAKPGGRCGYRCGTSVATGTPSSSAASAGAGVRMSDTATSGANDAHHRPRLHRRPHRGRVRLQRRLRGREDLVLGRRRERPSRPPRPAPASAATSAAPRRGPRATSASPSASIGNA